MDVLGWVVFVSVPLAGVLLLIRGVRRGSAGNVLAGLLLAAIGGSVLYTTIEMGPGASPSAATSTYRRKTSQSDAMTACQAQVRENLVSPRSYRLIRGIPDRPVWSDAQRQWRWNLDVEAQNALGVWLQSRWNCVILDESQLVRVEQTSGL